ncbi:MAG: molecular chaperone TorD family protein [Gordonibacter sp.]|nr:molecular chaperone TorD family protein [Gordonibacter sp.]
MKTSQLPDQDLLAKTLSEADMYRLLSICLLPPTLELAQGIEEGSLEADVHALFDDLRNIETAESSNNLPALCMPNKNSEIIFYELRKDYTHLFTHPTKPQLSLYEMQFCDVLNGAENPSTLFLNEAALHAEQCYRKAGMTLNASGSREPADHIAIELEFMSYLFVQIASSIQNKNEDCRLTYETVLTEFSSHLSRWSSAFFTACAQSNRGVFYPWLGKIGVSFFEQVL